MIVLSLLRSNDRFALQVLPLYFPRTTVRPKRDVVPIAARPFPAQDRVSGEALAGLDRRVTGRVMIAHPSRLLPSR
jgi:hypothetical protein